MGCTVYIFEKTIVWKSEIHINIILQESGQECKYFDQQRERREMISVVSAIWYVYWQCGLCKKIRAFLMKSNVCRWAETLNTAFHSDRWWKWKFWALRNSNAIPLSSPLACANKNNSISPTEGFTGPGQGADVDVGVPRHREGEAAGARGGHCPATSHGPFFANQSSWIWNGVKNQYLYAAAQLQKQDHRNHSMGRVWGKKKTRKKTRPASSHRDLDPSPV